MEVPSPEALGLTKPPLVQLVLIERPRTVDRRSCAARPRVDRLARGGDVVRRRFRSPRRPFEFLPRRGLPPADTYLGRKSESTLDTSRLRCASRVLTDCREMPRYWPACVCDIPRVNRAT
jgi:hypothetical protein